MTAKTLHYLVFIPVMLINYAFTGEKSAAANTTTGWKLEKSENNIRVYTRQSAGSNIKEYKAVAIVTATMAFLDQLIDNISDYPKWQANIATAEVLKQVNKTTRYIYYTTSVPWPLTNRDVVLLSEKVVDADGTITYNLTGKPDYIKEKENYIRIRKIKSICRLKPLGNHQIEITFESYGDPEGKIPDTLINLFMAESPYKTLLNLVKITEAKKADS